MTTAPLVIHIRRVKWSWIFSCVLLLSDAIRAIVEPVRIKPKFLSYGLCQTVYKFSWKSHVKAHKSTVHLYWTLITPGIDASNSEMHVFLVGPFFWTPLSLLRRWAQSQWSWVDMQPWLCGFQKSLQLACSFDSCLLWRGETSRGGQRGSNGELSRRVLRCLCEVGLCPLVIQCWVVHDNSARTRLILLCRCKVGETCSALWPRKRQWCGFSFLFLYIISV